MAMDAIIADLQEKRAVKIGVAYLCTPTDAHVIPAAANAASVNNLKRAPMWQQLFMGVSKVAFPKMALTKNSRKHARIHIEYATIQHAHSLSISERSHCQVKQILKITIAEDHP